MQDPAKQKKMYQTLSVVFAIAGFVWIVYGVFTPRFLLFPFIGLVNWAVAWYCKQSAKAG
jgi:hypothetical protein